MPVLTTPLTDTKDEIEFYLNRTERCLSCYSFAALFAWTPFYTFDVRTIGGNLCIFAEDELGRFLYLPPLGGEITAKVLDDVFAVMQERNGKRGISRIENVDSVGLTRFGDGRYKIYKKYYEYCYWRGDIAGLKGNAYKPKRALYNYFAKNYESKFCAYDRVMKDECLELYDRWAKMRLDGSRDDNYAAMLKENRAVHEALLENASIVGLTGRVVLVDGRIVAYTFGYPLNEKIFCISVEIADLNFKGLSVYIFRQFCADRAVIGHSFINVMDDFELQNLGWTKRSFRPTIQFPSYTVSRNGEYGQR